MVMAVSTVTGSHARAKTSNTPPVCGGTNLFDEFSKEDPDRFAKVGREARATKNGDAIFWKVTKPGGPPSYLFGTVHLTDPRVTVLSPAVKAALKETKTLALEVADLSPTALARALASAVNVTIYTDGQSLKTKLTTDEFAKVARQLKTAGMPVQTASVFRPWVITMLLASSQCERKRASAGKRILDAHISDLAKKQGSKIVGLESLDDQLKALSASPPVDQLAMLKVGLAYVERSNDLVETLIQFYLKRDLGAIWPFQIALAERIGVPARTYDSFYDNLIKTRNQRMHAAALPHLEKGGVFIAVGALHLPGDDGLVALLRASGYTVTPIE